MQTLINQRQLVALWIAMLSLSQPTLALAQEGPTGTGKTLSAALLGQPATSEAATTPDGLQAGDGQADSEAAKIPGLHKATDVTLKRG